MWTTSRLLFLSPPWPPPVPPFINIATSVLSTAVSSIAQACQVFRRAKHFRRVDQFLTCSGNTYTTQSPGRPLADDDSATWATGSSSWGSNVFSCRTCAKHFQKSFGQIYRRMGEITGSFWVGATEEASNTGYCRLTCTLHRYPDELFFLLPVWLAVRTKEMCVCEWERVRETWELACPVSPRQSCPARCCTKDWLACLHAALAQVNFLQADVVDLKICQTSRTGKHHNCSQTGSSHKSVSLSLSHSLSLSLT